MAPGTNTTVGGAPGRVLDDGALAEGVGVEPGRLVRGAVAPDGGVMSCSVRSTYYVTTARVGAAPGEGGGPNTVR